MNLGLQERETIERLSREKLVDETAAGRKDYTTNLNGKLPNAVNRISQTINTDNRDLNDILKTSIISIILADKDSYDNWQEVKDTILPYESRISLIARKAESLDNPYKILAAKQAHAQVENELARRAVQYAKKAESLQKRLQDYQKITNAYAELPNDHPAKAEKAGIDEYLALVTSTLGKSIKWTINARNAKADYETIKGRRKLFIEKVEPDKTQFFKTLGHKRKDTENPGNRIAACRTVYENLINKYQESAAQYAALSGTMALIREKYGNFPALPKSRSQKQWAHDVTFDLEQMEYNNENKQIPLEKLKV